MSSLRKEETERDWPRGKDGEKGLGDKQVKKMERGKGKKWKGLGNRGRGMENGREELVVRFEGRNGKDDYKNG